MIYLATQSQDNRILYYRWTYKEEWEIRSEVFHVDFNNVCWGMETNLGIQIGSAEKTVSGKLTDRILVIMPSNRKLSVLYRINVKQNAISKRAFDYFANIKRNTEQIGDIFSPTPSELRGNITCITDPDRPVIGFIDVSTTTQKQRYISHRDNLYEPTQSDCYVQTEENIGQPAGYILIGDAYVKLSCMECTLLGGSTIKPVDWDSN